jgi:predicted amidohydrolase YtcJ
MCDLILHNANVITLDPMRPRAELVAINGSQIVMVAGNEQLGRLWRPKTQVIDCNSSTMLPGFVDAHGHIFAYAKNLVSLRLSPQENIRSISDIQRSIRDYSLKQPAGAWIRGIGYNEFYIAEKRHPNRWDLDAAAPLHPVKLTHRSGHAQVLNSLALQRVGISEDSGDPPGGLIDRDPETGKPTGILYGMGAYLAAKIPPLEDVKLERGLTLVNEKLLSYGITSVQDASATNDRKRWRQFEAVKLRGAFKPRVTMMLGKNSFDESRQDAFSSCLSEADFKLGGVKIVVERVAGDLNPGQEELNEQISAIHEAGFQAVIHAIEEPEIEAACNAIAYALTRHPKPDHRHRIEHCSVCSPPLIRKMAAIGIVVVTQPSFIYYHGNRYLEQVPIEQQPYLYAMRSFLHHGLMVGSGSDFPVVDPNPLVGIGAAVTRMTQGGGTVATQQGIAVSEALIAHTLGAAAAGFEEGIKGSISPGKAADLVVLSDDPFTVEPNQIKNIPVWLTILDGKVVWEGACD